jgi:predicted DNA-binding transcriptional regulator YafY
MNRIDRLLGYLLMFQGRRRVRAQDFAEKFEISERTVYRDVQALGEIGVPILAVPGEGYRLMEGYHLPPIMFTQAEARALFLSVSMLTGLAKQGETRQAAQSALEKIRAILPRATLAEIEALQAVLSFYVIGRQPLDLDDATFTHLQQAIHERRVAHLRYLSPVGNQLTERDVEPLHLAYIDSTWVLRAWCRLRQDQRNFRLDRIEQLTLTTETFVPREVERPRLPLEGWRVLARFAPETVRWVREAQHFSFVEALEEDETRGALLLYQVVSFDQIVGRLLSWGSQVEVLEPPELRAELAQMAARLLERYQ